MITTSAEARAPHTLPSSPVVLVVEDEFLVRVNKVDILRDAGLRVLEAQDADEALDMLRRGPRHCRADRCRHARLTERV